MGKYSLPLIVGLCCLIGGTILGIAACASYGWAEASNPIERSFGLWRGCVTYASVETCVSIEEVSAALNGCRRTVIPAIIHGGIASLLALYFAYLTKLTAASCSRSTTYGVLITGIISFLLYVTVSILYGVTYKDDYGSDFKLGRAFYLNNMAALGIIVGTVCVFASFNMRPTSPAVGPSSGTSTVLMTHYPQHPNMGGPPTMYGVGGPQPPPYPGHGTHAPVYPVYGQQPAYPPTAYPPAPQNMYDNKWGATDPAYPPQGPPPNY